MARVEPRHLGIAQQRHRTAAVGGPIERRVVQHHDLTVGGGMHVELEHVGTVGTGTAKRNDRVLGRDAGGASVSEGPRGRSGKGGHQRPAPTRTGLS